MYSIKNLEMMTFYHRISMSSVRFVIMKYRANQPDFSEIKSKCSDDTKHIEEFSCVSQRIIETNHLIDDIFPICGPWTGKSRSMNGMRAENVSFFWGHSFSQLLLRIIVVRKNKENTQPDYSSRNCAIWILIGQ